MFKKDWVNVHEVLQENVLAGFLSGGGGGGHSPPLGSGLPSLGNDLRV